MEWETRLGADTKFCAIYKDEGAGGKIEFKIGKSCYRERRQSLQTPVFQQSLESSLGVVPSRVGFGAPVHLTTQLDPGYFLSFFS